MYYIEIPERINNIISILYRLGLWNTKDKPTVREIRIKFFYSIYYSLFPISLMVGAITCDNKDQSVFLAELSIAAAVLSMKFFYIIWRKTQILEVLIGIGVYSVKDLAEFTLVNDKFRTFSKYISVLFITSVFSGCTAAVIPYFGSESELFLKIGFPFDWKNNEIAFWMANAFILSEIFLTIIAIFFSIMIWYSMINCALRYKILGIELKEMGTIKTSEATANKQNVSVEQKHNLFFRDLVAKIDSHQHTKRLISHVSSFFSNLFFVQIVTSGLCICGSIYCLAFNAGENYFEHFVHLGTLLFNVAEIFMIMYFGNEILLSSDTLSYCLFESNWIDQPQVTKNLVITFGELLKQPHQLVIGQLYPLNLETFTRILKFAYNTFNILKNLN